MRKLPEMADSPRGAAHIAALAAIERFARAGLAGVHGEHVPVAITQGALDAILEVVLDVAGDGAAHDAMSRLRDHRSGEPGRWPVGAPLEWGRPEPDSE
jgi:hypothetical protein